MFFWPGVPIDYQVIVSDAEDGDTLAGTIDPHRVAVAFDRVDEAPAAFVPPPVDADMIARTTPGKALAAKSNCPICHAVSGQRLIPTYEALAEAYKGLDIMTDFLATRIIDGSSGTWVKDGTTLMPPHPEFSMDEARAMARYILAQGNPVARQNWLPVRGTAIPRADEPGTAGAPQRYVLWASYTDQGIQGKNRKTGLAALELRAPALPVRERSAADGVEAITLPDGAAALAGVQPRSLIQFEGIDLTDVRVVEFVVSDFAPDWAGGRIELRVDDPLGKPLGQVTFEPQSTQARLAALPMPITAAPGRHHLYVYLRGLKGAKKGSLALTSLKLQH
jgi:cytochrome c